MITDGGLGLVLMIGLILAYAAAITSLGLAAATWVPRLGRVITVSVMAYLLVAVGWPIALQVLPNLPAFRTMFWRSQPNWDGLSLASPFFGVYATTEWASRWSYGSDNFFTRGFDRPLANYDPTWPLIWIGAYSAIALILTFATLRTFDRCLGRVPESRRA
jgi:hypothetical protein